MKSTDSVQPTDLTLADKAVWTAPQLIDLNGDLGDVHLGGSSGSDGNATGVS